jgi:hypothetical protein
MTKKKPAAIRKPVEVKKPFGRNLAIPFAAFVLASVTVLWSLRSEIEEKNVALNKCSVAISDLSNAHSEKEADFSKQIRIKNAEIDAKDKEINDLQGLVKDQQVLLSSKRNSYRKETIDYNHLCDAELSHRMNQVSLLRTELGKEFHELSRCEGGE